MLVNSRTHQNYVVILPAYNEAESIGNCLDALLVATHNTPHTLERVVICINGCTDDTKTIVASYASKLPLTIITSPLGFVHAMNALFSYVHKHHPKAILVKTDADSIIAADAIQLMLNQFQLHPKLVVVGGHPLPRVSSGLNIKQRILARTFSLRALYPLSQVTIADTSNYHTACLTDPQPNIGDRELRLKTYFHGRLWCARTASSIPNLSKEMIGDDVYLSIWIHKTYGPDSIRVIYKANTFSAPNYTFRRHWMVYKRIHEDIRRAKDIPKSDRLLALQRTRLDWRYILQNVKTRDVFLFFLYSSIQSLESISFRFTTYKNQYWQYDRKEV